MKTKDPAVIKKAVPFWQRHWSLLLLTLFILGAVGYNLAQPPDDEQIAEVLVMLQQGVEQQKPEMLRAVISTGYIDQYRFNRERLLQSLEVNAWKTFTLVVRVTSREIQLRHNTAMVRCQVEVEFNNDLLDPFTETYTLELDLRRETDGWKLISSRILDRS